MSECVYAVSGKSGACGEEENKLIVQESAQEPMICQLLIFLESVGN